MTDTPEVHILALQTPDGYLLHEVPANAWKKLSPTLRYSRFCRDAVVYQVKAQTWIEDDELTSAIEDHHAVKTGAAF